MGITHISRGRALIATIIVAAGISAMVSGFTADQLQQRTNRKFKEQSEKTIALLKRQQARINFRTYRAQIRACKRDNATRYVIRLNLESFLKFAKNQPTLYKEITRQISIIPKVKCYDVISRPKPYGGPDS